MISCGSFLKQKGDDSRAFIKDNFNKLLSDKTLKAFVQLIKDNTELELCFRGNDDNESFIIYRNNHIVFKVDCKGKTIISFNHARYCPNWKEYLMKLKEKGFSVKDIDKYKKKKEKVEFYDFGYLKCDSLKPEDINDIYKKLLKKIYDIYFETVMSEKSSKDYFKVPPKDASPSKPLEKIRQQQLFSALSYQNKDFKDYCFYDMEYQQKGANGGNKPDMQAIRFENGIPKALVFVEVKCTNGSMNGSSGLEPHIRRMHDYFKNAKNENIDKKIGDRKKEACDILNQYSLLGLRDLKSADCSKFKEDIFKKLQQEFLIILTDEAKHNWDNTKRVIVQKLRGNKLNVNISGIGVVYFVPFSLEEINNLLEPT